MTIFKTLLLTGALSGASLLAMPAMADYRHTTTVVHTTVHQHTVHHHAAPRHTAYRHSPHQRSGHHAHHSGPRHVSVQHAPLVLSLGSGLHLSIGHAPVLRHEVHHHPHKPGRHVSHRGRHR